MLWGIPFLTAGEGLSAAQATLVTTVYIVVGMVVGPIMGTLSGRMPNHRSRALVLPSIAFQMVAWLAVIAWPGPAPLWLLFVLAVAMGIGGPASMIAFDHARTHNPTHRLSTATGITNTGGFISSLVAIFLIGAALDLQGAGTPETYSLEAFRVAALTLVPLWVIGSFFIVLERRRTRVLLGMDQPRRRRSPRP
jgi:MFS family permease